MMLPTPANFASIRGRCFQGSQLGNPRWFKYHWWIYTEQTLIESEWPFFENDPAGVRRRTMWDPSECLSTFDAMLKARDLDDRFESYFLYNRSAKRDDPSAPWDIAVVRRNGGGVAPAYDDDTDRPWREHK
jgi:hypothetical protein